MSLTAQQLQSFNEQGFLVVEGFVDAQTIKMMKTRALEIIEQCDPEKISVFSTRNQTKKTDDLFLRSANSVEVFFEEGAFNEHGKLTKPKKLAINKIGHAMHDILPEFKEWSRSACVAQLLKSLGYVKPLPVQSMYIFKQPGIGGEVVPHQDSTFLSTTPESVVGLWIALEDATVANGCLWGLPQSHVHGTHRKFIRDAHGSVSFIGEMPKIDLKQAVPIEVKAGDLVVLHGANIHFSKENTSSASRHAFSVHYVEGADNVTWNAYNWLQRDENFPFTPVYEL